MASILEISKPNAAEGSLYQTWEVRNIIDKESPY